MKFYVNNFPDYRIAYMRRIGQYGAANNEVLENLKKWAKEKGLYGHSILFAVAQDNPETTPVDNCRFDACIVIPEHFQLQDERVLEGKLTGGKYVVFKIKHTEAEIQKAYAYIFSSLSSLGFNIDNKPILEKYIGDVTHYPYCEICVPIK